MQTDIEELVSSRVADACRDMVPVSTTLQEEARKQIEAIANTDNKVFVLETRLKDIEAKVAAITFSAAQIHRLVDQITHIEIKLANITKAMQADGGGSEPSPICLSYVETRAGNQVDEQPNVDENMGAVTTQEPGQIHRTRTARVARATRRKSPPANQGNVDSTQVIIIE
jgi:hypothetical protein